MQRVLLDTPYDWGTAMYLTADNEGVECLNCRDPADRGTYSVAIGEEEETTTGLFGRTSSWDICLYCVQDVEEAIRQFDPSEVNDDTPTELTFGVRYRDSDEEELDRAANPNCVVCDGAVETLENVLEVGRGYGYYIYRVHWTCSEQLCDALAAVWEDDRVDLLAAAL